ncbi:MAG: FAD-dependent oxidoreductase [Phycisphaerae bacterium]|nr:FAD-dependent oxidoreductase [Phycisphaerae bacterium]
MANNSQNESYWMHTAKCRGLAGLEEDIETDVAVVGAGITGLTTALLLQEAGKQVVVIDMNRVGVGTTGHSTGHLDATTDQLLQNVESSFGADGARQVVEAKRAAVDLIERWNGRFNLDSEFTRVPAFFYTEDEDGEDRVEKEFEVSREAGLEVELVDGCGLPFGIRRAVRYADQARFSPWRYVCGLAGRFIEHGGRIFEDTRAENIEETDRGGHVATNRCVLLAPAVVLAGHAPLLGLFTLEPRIHPFQSYVLGVRVLDEVPDGLYWDTDDPYHYTRIASSGDPKLLIVGGADHRTGTRMDTHECFEELERYVRDRYRVEAIEYRWSHEFFLPADGLPYIGQVPGMECIFQATAYAGDGLTYGTAAGMLMSDLILGRENPYAKLFSASRRQALVAAAQVGRGVLRISKHFVGDWFGSGDVESVDDIPCGEGRLVTVDSEPMAVYRDDENNLHAMSPVCRHMKCIVHWNNAEKTWDCPCHGGRYDRYGNVIMGPPKRPLEARVLTT